MFKVTHMIMNYAPIGVFALIAVTVANFGFASLLPLAKLVLLHAMIAHGDTAALVLVPFAARIAPLFWARWIAPLHEGLGARFRGAIRPIDRGFWATGLLAAAWSFPALLAAIPAAALWGRWIARRMGGISGDGHGAGIELIETTLLLAFCAGAKA